MSGHDYFLELGALAAIGQISEAEDRELGEHLSSCAECREAYSDYSSIMSNHLPSLNPARFHLKKEFVHPSSPEEIRDRFIARARVEGAQFSSAVDRGAEEGSSSSATIHWSRLLSIGSSAALACLAVWAVVAARIQPEQAPTEIAALKRQNEVLRSALHRSQQVLMPANGATETAGQSAQVAQARVLELQRQLQASKARISSLRAALDQLTAEKGTLVSRDQKDQQKVRDLEAQLSREKDNSAATLASLVETQDKIRGLNNAVAEGQQRLAMERQLSSVTSDVRQLMGARNLHIIDVHDVNPAGRTGKSFGRVFYAENKSLVFYAFDLPSNKSTKYTFQAWGQREGNENSVHNLGTFSVDDHEQRRWVLKVSDPGLLKGIDSVFVTAETMSDSPTPKGKRILYAYFAGQANHP